MELTAALEVVASLIVVPWLIWVTNSIFSHRQEISLLKLEIEQNKEIHKLLHEIIEKLDK